MGTAQVKGHVRKTKGGKLSRIITHARSVIGTSKKHPTKDKAFAKKVEAMVRDKVKKKSDVGKILAKYGEYPMNMKVMVNSTWRNVTIKGKQKRQIKMSSKEFSQLLKDNGGLLYRIVNRFNFRPELVKDLKQVAHISLFEALNNYEAKYDPSNPIDITKHFTAHIAGRVQAEIARQLASITAFPHNKAVLFTKFKNVYDRFNGDWDEIAKEMKIKKKDLYPKIKDGGEESLPRTGYVTVSGEKNLEGKLKKHEITVNHLKSEYEKKLDVLDQRLHGFISDEDQKIFDEGVKAFGGEKKRLEKKKNALAKEVGELTKKSDGMWGKYLIAKEKDDKNKEGTREKKLSSEVMLFVKEKKNKIDLERATKKTQALKVVDELGTLDNKKHIYEEEMKPLDQAGYDEQKGFMDSAYQADLRDAKSKLERQTKRATIEGVYPLFRQFEEVMNYTKMNLSKTLQGEQGDSKSIEDVVANPEDVPIEEQITLKLEYKTLMDKFKNTIEDSLTKRASKLMKMHLGLSQDNKLYPHGLWGEPMTITQISKVIKKDFFPSKARDKAHKGLMDSWKGRKPPSSVNTKKDPKKFKKETKEWKGRMKKAKAEISKKTKPKSLLDAKKMRDRIYKKHKATYLHEPKKFQEVKVSPVKYANQLKVWRKSKPSKDPMDYEMRSQVSRELDLGKIIIRKFMPASDVHNLVRVYRTMRRYGIRKATIKEDILKSLIFDGALGITYERYSEETILMKAYSKVKSVFQKIL